MGGKRRDQASHETPGFDFLPKELARPLASGFISTLPFSALRPSSPARSSPRRAAGSQELCDRNRNISGRYFNVFHKVDPEPSPPPSFSPSTFHCSFLLPSPSASLSRVVVTDFHLRRPSVPFLLAAFILFIPSVPRNFEKMRVAQEGGREGGRIEKENTTKEGRRCQTNSKVDPQPGDTCKSCEFRSTVVVVRGVSSLSLFLCFLLSFFHESLLRVRFAEFLKGTQERVDGTNGVISFLPRTRIQN